MAARSKSAKNRPSQSPALREFARDLAFYARIHRTKAEDRQFAIIGAMVVVTNFIRRSFPGNPAISLSAPFRDVEAELGALWDGARSPLFEPSPVHSRPREPWAREHERGLSVAATEVLAERGGMSLEAAARAVAAQFRDQSRKSVTARRILGWRKEFRRSTAKREGAESYRSEKEVLLENCDGMTRAQLKREVAVSIRLMLRILRVPVVAEIDPL